MITADIPLASRCLAKGARDAGATRDLRSDLRDAGAITRGPPPLEESDRSRFLQQLDQVIQAIRRKHPSEPEG